MTTSSKTDSSNDVLKTLLVNLMSYSKEGATQDVVVIVGVKFGLCEMIGH